MTPEIKRLRAEVDSRICSTCSDLATSCLDDEREAVDAERAHVLQVLEECIHLPMYAPSWGEAAMGMVERLEALKERLKGETT